jgi:hypothetical protein
MRDGLSALGLALRAMQYRYRCALTTRLVEQRSSDPPVAVGPAV